MYKKISNFFYHKFFSAEKSFNERLSNVFVFSIILASSNEFVITFIIGASLLSGICTLFLLAASIVLLCLKSTVRQSRPVVVGMCVAIMITFPLMLFTRGYLKSGMPVYYILGCLFFALMFEGRTFAVIFLIFVMETIASYVLANFFPQLIISVKFPQYAYLDVISSFAVASIVLALVIKVIRFQKRVYKEEQERVENVLEAKQILPQGFNGHLPKPAESAAPDGTPNRGMPLEKQEKEPQKKAAEAIMAKKKTADTNGAGNEKLEDLNVKRGIVLTGGTEMRYRNVLAVYMKDVQSRLPQLLSLNQALSEALKDKAYEKGAVDEKTLLLLTRQILALKSASAGIGAEKVSAQAALLEQAGNEGNLAGIRERLPDFCESLKSLIGLIEGTLGQSLPLVSATGMNRQARVDNA